MALNMQAVVTHLMWIVVLGMNMKTIHAQSHTANDLDMEEEIKESETSWFGNNPESYYVSMVNAMLIAFAFVAIATLACCARTKTDDIIKLKFMQNHMETKEGEETQPLVTTVDMNQFQYQSLYMIDEKEVDEYQSL